MYNLQNVADILKVSLHTVRRLLHQGNVPYFKVGRQIRIKPSDIDHFLKKVEVDEIHIEHSEFIPPDIKHQIIEDLGIKV